MGGFNGNVIKFDEATEQFTVIPQSVTGVASLRGLQVDRNGVGWVATNNPCGVLRVDTAGVTLAGPLTNLDGCSVPVGVSIDVEGFVWVVDQSANRAYKVDPMTLQATTTEGLVGPYTYSDMTGAGLSLVVNPPAG